MKDSLRKLADWFDDRTGARQLMHDSLYEDVPGGSRWIYISGSMLVFAFVTQAITGLFLWMFYSAGSQNAWESVYWIQNRMQGGWFLRGVHHYMAQAMVVLLPLHLLQVVICKAYVKPREINFWLGLVLMQITLALGLTGYLLPWDQKGYWATKVATELMSLPPGGNYIQKLVVGGSEYGHYTLTRFFAMHAGVLPALLIGVLVLHVAMFRKHGITAVGADRRPAEYFWPGQVFKDAAGCLVLMGIVVAIVIHHHGADLGPPAEPTEAYGAARPEWYYLFLFQLLKKFHNEFVGAIVVPGAVMAFLFALPLVAKIKYGHVVNVCVILILVGTAGYLTYEAIDHDNYRDKRDLLTAPSATDLERIDASQKFHLSKDLANQEYQRVEQLIDFYGIPKQGATLGLVRDDPEIQGPRLFLRNCASCHSYQPDEQNPVALPGPNAEHLEHGDMGAPNLYGFASRAWLTGLLNPERIIDDDYFGATLHAQQIDGGFKSGGMVEYVCDTLTDLSQQQQAQLKDLIATLSAEANLPQQAEQDATSRANGQLKKGREALVNEFSCIDCHKFHDEGDLGSAPDLTGYGSANWLREFISDPNHERFYAATDPADPATNDRMPAFARFTDAAKNQLTDHEIEMLVLWLRSDKQDLKQWEQRRSAATAYEADPVSPPAVDPP